MGSEVGDNNDRAVQIQPAQPADNTSSLLMPSWDSWKQYNACGPDYNGALTQPPIPTEKRLAYNVAAVHTLNQPTDTTVSPPLSRAEKQKADQAVRVISKYQKDDAAKDILLQLQDTEVLKDIFAGVSPQEASRIISTINPELEKQNFKLAQAETGEIWAGRRESLSDAFYLWLPIKEIDCDPNVS